MRKKIVVIVIVILLSVILYLATFVYLVVALLNKKFTVNEGIVSTSPAVAGKSVYFGGIDGYLYALNIDNGKLKWKKGINKSAGDSEEGEIAIYSAPLVAANTVFIPDNNNHLYAFDADTGAKKWSIKTPEMVGSMTYSQGVLFFESIDIYAVDVKSGKTKWKAQTDSGLDVEDLIAEGALVFDNDTLYLSTYNGKLYAINAIDGVRKWKTNLKTEEITAPFVDDRYVYVGSAKAGLFAVDKYNGKLKWNAKKELEIIAPPTVSNNTIYFGTDDSRYYALNGQTRKEVWSFDIGDSVVSKSLINDGAIFFGTHNALFKLDASGKKLWESKKGCLIDLPPAISGKKVFVSTGEGSFHALDIDTGETVWKVPEKKRKTSMAQAINEFFSMKEDMDSLGGLDD